MPAIAVENNKEGKVTLNKKSISNFKAELKLTIEEKDMQCCICLESVSDRIYQCVKGPHYCCEECTKTYIKKNECLTFVDFLEYQNVLFAKILERI